MRSPSLVALLLALCAAAAPLAAADAPAPAHQRPVLGLTLGEPEPLGAAPGLPVERVAAGGSAEAMGVHVGDRLLAANGHEVKNAADLGLVLDALASLGDAGQLQLSLSRDGRTLEVSDALRPTPDPRELARRQAELEARLARIAAAPRDEPAQLQRLLAALGRLESGLAAAREGLARSYPQGELELRVDVEIRSDASDATARELVVHGPASAAPAATPSAVAPPSAPTRAEAATP